MKSTETAIKIRYFAAAVALILAASVAVEAGGSREQVPVTYFPVHVGDIWHYDYDQPETSEDTPKTIKDYRYLLGTKYYRWVSGRNEDRVDTVRVDSDGNVIWFSRGWELMWFDFSKDSGSTYDCYVPYWQQVTVCKFVSHETAMGVFDNCVEFCFDWPDWMDDEVYYVFAPNVGLISERHDGWSVYSLTSAVIDHQEVKAGIHAPEIPEGYAIRQNYPNPFNRSTVIDYRVPASGDVRMELFDVQGRRVDERFEGRKSAGAHTLVYANDGLASGVYFYRLTHGRVTLSGKMVLQK